VDGMAPMGAVAAEIEALLASVTGSVHAEGVIATS